MDNTAVTRESLWSNKQGSEAQGCHMNLCFSQLCRRAKGDLMSVSFCLSSKIALSKFVPSLKSVVSQTRDLTLTLTFTPTTLDYTQ